MDKGNKKGTRHPYASCLELHNRRCCCTKFSSFLQQHLLVS